MAETITRFRSGLWRTTKWVLALLVIVYVGWVVGLGPKGYRSATSYAVPAYFSDPDPECRAQPTPECLAEMAEQSIYDIFDHYGGYPFEAEYVGMLHARLGNFERADRLAAWLEEHRYWEPLGDEPEGPVTPFYVHKIGYLLRVGKWREALAIVAEFGGARQGIIVLSSKCADMQSIALGRAIEGRSAEALEILARMADFGCGEGEEPGIEAEHFLPATRRSIDLLLLLHLPRDEITRHPDYQEALWEWLSAPNGDFWISWQTPPAFADYCDVLTSIDHNAHLEEWQIRTLLLDLLKVGAMPHAKEVLEKIVSRPSGKKWLLDWFQDLAGFGSIAEGTNIRFIADNYLTDEERRLIAPRVAESAAWRLDEETIEWAKAYLSPENYEAANNEYERYWRGDRAMFNRLIKIQEDYRDDYSKSTEALKALSDEYIWRWYHALASSIAMTGANNRHVQSSIISNLFQYGEGDAGFEIIRKLAYRPNALTAAAWGLMNRESGLPDYSCHSSM